MLAKRIYLKYRDDTEKEKVNQTKIKMRIENEKNDNVRRDLFKSKGLNKVNRLATIDMNHQSSSLYSTGKKSTLEILLGYIITKWDIIIVTALYFAGSYQIDIYHIILMIFFVLFLLYPNYYRDNYIYLIIFVHVMVFWKYFYVLTHQWYSEILDSYLVVIGFATDVHDRKFFKSNLFNNNWLIILLSYIQYRTYKSTYYQEKLNPEMLKRDQKEFRRKHPKCTSFLRLTQDVALIGILIVSFAIYKVNAYLLTLIIAYVYANKDTSKSIYRLLLLWNVGIGFITVQFLSVLFYQVVCLEPIAKSDFVQHILSLIPTFIIKNADLLGFRNYNKEQNIQMSIVLLYFVLNFVFAVLVKRRLTKLHAMVKMLEDEFNFRENGNKIDSHKYFGWIIKNKWLWPILDFIARFMFIALGFVVMAISIHWKLCFANLIFIGLIWGYYISISYSLRFQPQDKFRDGYENMNDDTLDIEEIIQLSKSENEVARMRILNYRKLYAILIFSFAWACLLLTYLTIPIDTLRERYPEYKTTWNYIVIISFVFGTNATKGEGNYSLTYQWLGFLFILIFSIFEKKSQMWLKDNFSAMKIEDTKNLIVDLDESKSLEEINKIISDKSEVERKSRNSKNESMSKYSLNFDNSKDNDSDDSNRKSLSKEQFQKQFESIFNDDKETSFIKIEDMSTQGVNSIADDPQFKRQVHNMLKIKYSHGFMRATSSFLFTLIILLLMFCIIFNWNAVSVVLFISVAFTWYKNFSFISLIYINLFLVVIYILQYAMALSNLSAKNSPIVFPDPFTDFMELEQLFIPWYRKVDFFTSNDDAWSFYCSLMISFKRVKNLWFNGSILLLANLYFTTFYSTIYNQNIEISNEKNINDIIKIQGDTIAKMYEKKYHEKSAKTEEQFYEKNEADYDPFAAKFRPITDDQINKMITLFYASSTYTKFYNAWLNVICSFGGLLTLIMLLIITYQLTGLINFVYVIFWLYHIYNFRKFLNPSKYTLPMHIGYLKLYLYWDLFINILYQIPFQVLHKADHTKNWQKIFGIYSFWYIDPVTEDITFQNISVIITKSLMFCLIILLDNMMQSSAYKHFWHEKLIYLRDISTTKARCLTYLYNNNKLRKIIKIQYDKDAMTQKIKTMKKQLHLWNKKYLSTEDVEKIRRQTLLHMADDDLPDKYQMRLRTDANSKGPKDLIEELKDDYSKSLAPDSSKVLHKKQTSKNKVSFMNIEEDMYTTDQYHIMEEEEALLNELKDEYLNWFTRFFNWLKRNYSNQMLLISSSNRLEAIENDLMHGKHRINTTLENKLLIKHYFDKDPDSHRIKRLNSSMPERFRVENYDYTDINSMNINRFQFSTIIGMCISNSSILCYFFMIFAHIINGSLISLVYPVSIFCYAIFEEIRPTKNYWKFIMFYTMAVLTLKSVVKFFFISDYIPYSLNEFLKNFRIGIETVNADRLPTNYYIFEVLIMLFVVMHMISLIFQGLWDEREIGFETIDEAAHRITNYNKKLFKDEIANSRRHQTERQGIIVPRS